MNENNNYTQGQQTNNYQDAYAAQAQATQAQSAQPQNQYAQPQAQSAQPQNQYAQQAQNAQAQNQYAQPQAQYTQAQGQYSQQPQYSAYGQNTQYQPQPHYAAPPADPEAHENRVLAALCYFGTIFMILGLVANGTSKHIRFHANQALALDIATVIMALIAIIPVLGWIVVGIGYFVLFIFRIIGIVNAMKCSKSELPLVGKYKIIN